MAGYRLPTPHSLPDATCVAGRYAGTGLSGRLGTAILDELLDAFRRIVGFQRGSTRRCLGLEIIAAFHRLAATPFGQVVICRIRAITHRRRINGDGETPVQLNFRLLALAAPTALGDDLGGNITPVKSNEVCDVSLPWPACRPIRLRQPRPANRQTQ